MHDYGRSHSYDQAPGGGLGSWRGPSTRLGPYLAHSRSADAIYDFGRRYSAPRQEPRAGDERFPMRSLDRVASNRRSGQDQSRAREPKAGREGRPGYQRPKHDELSPKGKGSAPTDRYNKLDRRPSSRDMAERPRGYGSVLPVAVPATAQYSQSLRPSASAPSLEEREGRAKAELNKPHNARKGRGSKGGKGQKGQPGGVSPALGIVPLVPIDEDRTLDATPVVAAAVLAPQTAIVTKATAVAVVGKCQFFQYFCAALSVTLVGVFAYGIYVAVVTTGGNQFYTTDETFGSNATQGVPTMYISIITTMETVATDTPAILTSSHIAQTVSITTRLPSTAGMMTSAEEVLTTAPSSEVPLDCETPTNPLANMREPTPDEVDTDPCVGLTSGLQPSTQSCDGFFMCSNQQLVNVGTCPCGYVYHPATMACLYHKSGYYQDPTDCGAFFRCSADHGQTTRARQDCNPCCAYEVVKLPLPQCVDRSTNVTGCDVTVAVL